MKILVLAHALRAGGGRATCMNILHALGQVDKGENQYYVLVPDQSEYRGLTLPSDRFLVRFYSHRLGYAKRALFDAFALPRIIRKFRPDVIWAMGGIGVRKPPCPQAVSIQNPYVMYPPEHWAGLPLRGRLLAFALRRAFRNQMPHVQLVICQTHTMEKRLRASYDYQGTTLVTWKAVSAFANKEGGATPASMMHYSKSFKLLYVTRYYPHKGLERLVEMFDLYRDELKGCTLFITIETSQSPRAARLLRSIQERGLDKRIVNLGRIAQKNLAACFRNCDALLMPTLLESFSGTYLEAMHFGVPILTSDMDFAREVCRDAAFYFDPWDPACIKDAILRARDQPGLREHLTESGARRLSEMNTSWISIARSILDDLALIAEHPMSLCGAGSSVAGT